jgi:predicted DNA-binding ArsR family transcriptional regulator
MTTKSRELLIKLDDIIEMLIKCDQRIKSSNDYLKDYFSEDKGSFTKVIYSNPNKLFANLKKYKAIKLRLQKYYANNLQKLVFVFNQNK